MDPCFCSDAGYTPWIKKKEKKRKWKEGRKKEKKKIIFNKKNLSSNLPPKNANITWLCIESLLALWAIYASIPLWCVKTPSKTHLLQTNDSPQASTTIYLLDGFLSPLFLYIPVRYSPPKSTIYNNQNIIQIATNMLCYLQKSHQLQNWLSFKWPAVSGSSLLAQKDLLCLWWPFGEWQLLGCLDFNIKILNEKSSQCLFKNPWKQTIDLSVTGITPGHPHALFEFALKSPVQKEFALNVPVLTDLPEQQVWKIRNIFIHLLGGPLWVFPYSRAHTHSRLPIQGCGRKTVNKLTLYTSLEIKTIHCKSLKVSWGGEPYQLPAPDTAEFSWDPLHFRSTAFKIRKYL